MNITFINFQVYNLFKTLEFDGTINLVNTLDVILFFLQNDSQSENKFV